MKIDISHMSIYEVESLFGGLSRLVGQGELKTVKLERGADEHVYLVLE